MGQYEHKGPLIGMEGPASRSDACGFEVPIWIVGVFIVSAKDIAVRSIGFQNFRVPAAQAIDRQRAVPVGHCGILGSKLRAAKKHQNLAANSCID